MNKRLTHEEINHGEAEKLGLKMKINRTTHDTAAGGPSSSRPSTLSRRIKDHFWVRMHRPRSSSNREEDEDILIEKERDNPQDGGVTAFLMHEQKELRRKQKGRKDSRTSKPLVGEKISGNETAERRLLDAAGSHQNERGNPSPPPPSRLKRTERVKRLRDLESSAAENRMEAEAEAYINRLRMQRAAISEGKLEKVIPPSFPTQVPLFAASPQPPPSHISGHKKLPSGSFKMSDYIATSADIMDATRREMASNLRRSAEKAQALSGKFRPPFDYLDYRSQGFHLNNGGDSDSDSDESFYCVGEKSLSELQKARRLSGQGSDPWIDGLQQECRLCKERATCGLRGLCRDCETAFKRPKTISLEDYSGAEDDIRPIPPLKTKKTPTNLKIAITDDSLPFLDNNTTGPRQDHVDRRPKLVRSDSHQSHYLFIEDTYHTPQTDTKNISKYETWQTPELRARYEEEEECNRWTRSFLEEDGDFPIDDTKHDPEHESWNIPRLRAKEKDHDRRRSRRSLPPTTEDDISPVSDTEYISKYERWQTPALRAEYKSCEGRQSQWSPSFLDNKDSHPISALQSKFNHISFVAQKDETDTPLIPPEGQGRGSKKTRRPHRGDSFYGFWDDVLNDHGVKSHLLQKRDDRYRKL